MGSDELIAAWCHLNATPHRIWLLSRFVMLLLVNAVLLQVHRVDCLRSWIFDTELLGCLADRHVLDMDLDNEVPAHLIVAEVVILDHEKSFSYVVVGFW